MALKLFVLRSGERIIAEAKQAFSGEKPVSYILEHPKSISIVTTEAEDGNQSMAINLNDWLPLSSDTSFVVPPEAVVTFCEPLEQVAQAYANMTGRNLESTGEKVEDDPGAVPTGTVVVDE